MHNTAIKSWQRKACPPTKTMIDSLNVGAHAVKLS